MWMDVGDHSCKPIVLCCLSSTRWYTLFVGWVMPSASVVAAEVPVDSRMTIVGTVVVVVVGNDDRLPLGISVACDSVVSKGNWLVVPIGKCIGDNYV
jgi:uncharacterized membrane protein YdcZ (DUF606 family)